MFLGTLRTSVVMSAYLYMPIVVNARRTAARELDEVELLALLRPSDVRGDERVHECLEVRSPPLRERVADLPLIVDTLACELCANWCKTLIEPSLKALDLVVFSAQVVAWSRRC
jgi:hypothetical protein